MSRIIKSTNAAKELKRYIPIHPIHLAPVIQDDVADLNDSIEKETANDEQAIPAEFEQEARKMIEQATFEAERLIHEAESRCQQMHDDARYQAENVRAEARMQGIEQGIIQGRQQAFEEAESIIAQSQDILSQIHLDRQRFLDEAELDIVEIACKIAGTIIGRESQVDREWVLHSVREALAELHDIAKVEIRVHPDDYSKVSEARENLIIGLPGQIHLSVVPDLAIGMGGCVILTAHGTVDARVDTQLGEIRKSLFQLARSEQA